MRESMVIEWCLGRDNGNCGCDFNNVRNDGRSEVAFPNLVNANKQNYQLRKSSQTCSQ